MKSLGQATCLIDCLTHQCGYLFGIIRFGQSSAIEPFFQQLAYHSNAGKLLAETIVQLLSNPRLFSLTDG